MNKTAFRYIFLLILSFSETYSFCQMQTVGYSGNYYLDLEPDSNFYFQQRLGNWCSGKYKWSNDTIFFNIIPIYDTLITIEKPKNTRQRELVLSNDEIGHLSVTEKFQLENEVLVVVSENGIIQLQLAERYKLRKMNVNSLYNDRKQVLEGFPQFLIKKHKKLGYNNSSGKYIKVLKLDKKRPYYLDRLYYWFLYKFNRKKIPYIIS